jgi:quercetin dioxygenase-like cupin family protein
MRRVITGVDDAGRSTVRSDGPPPVAFHATPTTFPVKVDGSPTAGDVPPGEAVVHQLWALGAEPEAGRADPTLAMEQPDFETPAGETSWIVTEMGPNLEVAMHHTQTVDYAVVVRGEVELGLETGPVTLRAGDMMLVDGVEHSWHAGPEGCTIATVQVGLSRPPGPS